MKNILVLGSSGLLGTELISGEYLKKYQLVTQSHKSESDIKLNLEENDEVTKMLYNTNPHVIINLVGLTNVDQCEKYPDRAYRSNVKTVENIVNAITKLSLKTYLIHISTDQVYDGLGASSEKKIKISNYYSFSKYCGELCASKVGSTILRTNFFGKSKASKRKSFTDWIYGELISGKNINVFEDVCFNPLSIYNLCKMIEIVAEKKIQGVFNLGSKDSINKADFAFHFAQALNLPTSNLIYSKVSDAKFLNAYRPKNMVMNINKFEKIFNIQLPKVTDQIKLTAKKYLHGRKKISN